MMIMEIRELKDFPFLDKVTFTELHHQRLV